MNWYFKNQSGEEFGPFDSQLEAVEESFRYGGFGFRMQRNEQELMEAFTTSSYIGEEGLDSRFRAVKILSVFSSEKDDAKAKADVAEQICKIYPAEVHSNYSHKVYQR